MGWKVTVLALVFILGCTRNSTRADMQTTEAVEKLITALETKPAAGQPAVDLKKTLGDWVQSTDEVVLLKLVRYMKARFARGSHKHVRRPSYSRRHQAPRHLSHGRHHSHEDRIPVALILKKLNEAIEQESAEDLKQLVASLNTAEGQVVLKALNVQPAALQTLLKQVKGGADDIAEARKTIKTLVETTAKKDQEKIRDIYKVYVLYRTRQKALEMVKKATAAELTRTLRALSRAERRHRFAGIKFADLLASMKSEKGHAEVVVALNKWINSADIVNIRRAGHYSSASARPPKTLDQVKSMVAKKIERKSAAQLIEFLEVLQTPEGVILMGKIHVKPATPIDEMIKKLKTKSVDDAASVRSELKAWILKLDLKDMQEFQNSRRLFILYRSRKAASEGVQKADLKSLLKVLAYLSQKEATGTKYEGIKFSDEKAKLDKDGEKSLDDVKKSIQAWIAKISLEQLAALRNVGREARMQLKEKPGSAKSMSQPDAPAKPPSNPSKSTVKKTSESASAIAPDQVKSASLFKQFATAKNSNGQLSATADQAKEAFLQVIQSGSNDDVKLVFFTAVRGLSGHAVKQLPEGLFKGQMLKTNGRVKKTSTATDWEGLRKDLKTWVGAWNADQSRFFLAWYRKGAVAKRARG